MTEIGKMCEHRDQGPELEMGCSRIGGRHWLSAVHYPSSGTGPLPPATLTSVAMSPPAPVVHRYRCLPDTVPRGEPRAFTLPPVLCVPMRTIPLLSVSERKSWPWAPQAAGPADRDYTGYHMNMSVHLRKTWFRFLQCHKRLNCHSSPYPEKLML